MRLQDYLDRIGFRDDVRPDLSTLRGLLASHVCTIPFENLDVQLGRAVSMDVAHAFEKIVANGRGGWCYEQNGLFGWALAEVGFVVTRMAAAVMRMERGEVSTANHLCLKVRTRDSDAEYLVDVGFGGSMFEPIKLDESDYEQPPFRIGLRRLADGHWQFWENNGKGEFSYDFLAQPASEAALAGKCDYLQTDPSSTFVLNLVAQLRAPEQHKALRGRVLSITTKNGIESRRLESAAELRAVLADEFQLDIPEVVDLWPRVTARHEALFNSEEA